MTANEQALYEELYELIANSAATYNNAVQAQLDIWEGRIPKAHPLILHCNLPQDIDKRFPNYHPGETHNDRVKMLLNGMKSMLNATFAGAGAVPSIRANMGCGIIPSLFPGVMPLLFDDGKMPWVKAHLSRDEISQLREKDIAITDEFKMALEHMAYIAEHIQGTGAYVFPVDIQGPFDVAHLVFGDQIFYAMYDEPDLVHHLLELSCYATELGYAECLKLMPNSDNVIAHYNSIIIPASRGGIKLSEDTTTIISPAQVDEFAIPYTQRILDFAGGGYIHYCGRNDHLFKRCQKMNNAYGINFGNPEMHDMEDILRQTSHAGKIYYGNVPMNEHESHRDYFKRIKKAATAHGKCPLLLSYWTDYEKKDEIIVAWNK